MNILIFGSCVTRDAFTFDKADTFKLIRYFARSSLATAFDSVKVEDSYTEQLKSPFQRKIVHADFCKEFTDDIVEKQYDYLILDFIDDRYDLFKFADGGKVLLTAELKQTDFLKRNHSNGQIISGWSEEWFQEWQKGCLQFIKKAQEYGLVSKILLNKVYWTAQLTNGEIFYDEAKVVQANSFLERQYCFIEKFLNKNNILNYTTDVLYANKDHMWGLSPFHYIDELYLLMLAQLKDESLRAEIHNERITASNGTVVMPNTVINQPLSNMEQVFSNELSAIKEQLSDIRKNSRQQLLLSKQWQDKSTQYEQTIHELTKNLEKVKAELNKTNQKIKQTKEQVENTLSFKLGYTLIHSTQSFSNFFALPSDLFKLIVLAKERRLNKGLPVSKPAAKLAAFPKVDGRFKKQYGIKFISILDEISHTSFESEFKLFPLNKTSFETQIQGSTSLGFLIESCWKGNFGVWEYAFTSPNLQHQNAQNLLKALDTAKSRNLPIVFWNKEDPMHYDKFLPISSKCDVIFTTDSNKVADYQRDVPNAKVDTLLFAANINICNPANRFRKEQENICFAGSYYGVGHDDRKKQMDALLPTIIKFKGAIYDRMSQLGNERYAYPRKYRSFIRPAVPFREIVDVYKQFKIFLNVNTITDSPTMMSRRVYELLACGTPVISTPSLAIDEQFKGIVQVAKNAKEANKIAKRLLENEWEWLRTSHLGYREVMLKHTYEHRAAQIANSLGKNIILEDPMASIIIASNRPHFIDRIVKNVSCQVYPNIEVIIIAQKYSDEQLAELEQKLKNSSKPFKAVHIIRNDSEDTLGARLNQGVALSKGEYIAKFDDDDFYFPNYLQDMLIPFKFGDYGIVGKKEIFIYLESQNKTFVRYKGQRHMETDFLTGATLVFSRKALTQLSFGDLNRGEDSNILEQAKKLKIKTYVADPFNFVVYRSKELSNHTWQVEDKFFTDKGVFVGEGLAEDTVKL